MAEKITRRTFLKVTGLAALSVAAAGALEGCGGLSPLPGNPTLPAVNSTSIADTTDFSVGIGALTGQWTSNQSYEPGDDKSHNYIYTGIYLHNASSSDITFRTSSFACAFGSNTTDMKVRCLGSNVALNSDYKAYSFQTELTLKGGESKTYPLYIDIGSTSFSSLVGTPVIIAMKAAGHTVTFKYASPSDDSPSYSVS